LNTKQFSWNKIHKEFSAFASDLGSFQFTRIYDDAKAEDVGLILRNEATGVETVFYLEYRDYSYGDIRYWTLRPIHEEVLKNTRLLGVKITIFND
jgi:hypothetical protein